MTEFEKKLWKLLCMTEAGGGGGGQSGEEYGVEWDYSNPSPVLTRTGDAASFVNPVPATSLAGTGSSPFDNIMPWAGMRMCNIINGEVVYWQGDPQFSETAYDTMVYIPEFWYTAEKDTANHKWRWSISPTEKDGYDRHPGSGRYIGRFHSSGSASAVYAKSGNIPLAEKTRSDFRTYSHNKGAKWWLLDLATWAAVQLLYLVEFANFDSQSTLGSGQDSGSVKASGGTTGAAYHTLKRSKSSNQYRWIEDPFTNVNDFADGIVCVNKEVYVGLDNSTFSDDASTLEKTGITLPPSGIISGFGYSDVCPWAFIPDESVTNSNNYTTDHIGGRSNGVTGLTVGGYSNVDSGHGMFYFNGSPLASTAASSYGARLIFIP